ncbi:hypothetical protein ACRE_036030 [Hapsidospora chrysogenum ATCC 11550]|uniref:Uncharacterized protein n=1 Tax=Hapsidospora chrysogenum (strain ATCC 11550 / CBS 779.69 / DSM 880 / IAM 14645 / JCM 23072 / IMI 49137) TaxID=857340 RepID=A0A086T874_HAPC1|nr:hypothetical protein ACRE_036030 [Hapsidospora chrysogenum ATCC 11550]
MSDLGVTMSIKPQLRKRVGVESSDSVIRHGRFMALQPMNVENSHSAGQLEGYHLHITPTPLPNPNPILFFTSIHSSFISVTMRGDRGLPRTVGEWVALASDLDLADASIHDNTNWASASKMDLDQAVLLRAVWSRSDNISDLTDEKFEWIAPSWKDKAESILKRWPPFQQYIGSLDPYGRYSPSKLENGTFPDLGNFSIVRYYQLKSQNVSDAFSSTPKLNFTPIMTRSRTRNLNLADARPSTPTPVVNQLDPAGLITPVATRSTPESLPNLSALHLSPVSPESGEFIDLDVIEDRADCQHGSPSTRTDNVSTKIFEARVDGCLRHRETKKILAIIEVKPHARYRDGVGKSIRMQEAGQMAAWISNNPPQLASNEKDCRLLVSQDRGEIYLTFATFDGEYVKYVQGLEGDSRTVQQPSYSNARSKKKQTAPDDKKTENRGYLIMGEYGPFRVTEQQHMHALGVIMLAYTLGCR